MVRSAFLEDRAMFSLIRALAELVVFTAGMAGVIVFVCIIFLLMH